MHPEKTTQPFLINPGSKHRPLFFTPRSPWGGRLKNHSFRRHMRASEDSRTSEKEALDQMNEHAENLKRMDQNNVPRSLSPAGERPGIGQTDQNGVPTHLQSQISPQRAGEITDPSRKPLPSPQIPRETEKAFPLDPKQQPLPPQSSQTSNGTGDLVRTQTHEQLPLSPDNANKSMQQNTPKTLLEKAAEFQPRIGKWKVNVHGGKNSFGAGLSTDF